MQNARPKKSETPTIRDALPHGSPFDYPEDWKYVIVDPDGKEWPSTGKALDGSKSRSRQA